MASDYKYIRVYNIAMITASLFRLHSEEADECRR